MKTEADKIFLLALGKNIRNVRKKNNLSLRQLELLCDIERGTISQYENGKQDPSASTLSKLAAAIGVHPAEFFKFELPEANRPIK